MFEPYRPEIRGEPVNASVRRATPADAPAIARISAEREGLRAEDIEPLIARQLAADDETLRVFVAEIAGEIVGYGRVRYAEPAPEHRAPTGWYLVGSVVTPGYRRRGVGRALMAERLRWVAERGATETYSFTSPRNLASIALHRELGFVELTRDFSFPRVQFGGGVGILFRRQGIGGRMTHLPSRTLVLRDSAGEPFGFLRLASADAPRGDCIFDIEPASPEQAQRSEVRWLQKRGYRRFSEHKFQLDDSGALTVKQGSFEVVLDPVEDGGFSSRRPAPPVTAEWTA